MLGVAVSTLRRWEKEYRLKPAFRTPGGHRRYGIEQIQELVAPATGGRLNVCYARVSSHDQKEDLERQKNRLVKWCEEQGIEQVELIDDLGSGLNYKKKGIKKLIRMIATGQIERLVVLHRDRLLRFGAEILLDLCALNGTQVLIIDDKQDRSSEEQLACDVIELMTVFSARLYGARSHKNRSKAGVVAKAA